MADKRYLFLVDDEPIQNEMLKDYLNERFVYDIKTFDNGEDALKNMQLHPEIVVLDFHLNSHNPTAKNGLDILKILKNEYPKVQVIMLSGQDNINVAVDSMKYGAYDYVVKGETSFYRIENTINRISELHRMNTIHEAQKKTITFLGIALVVILLLTVLLLTTSGFNV